MCIIYTDLYRVTLTGSNVYKIMQSSDRLVICVVSTYSYVKLKLTFTPKTLFFI